MRSQGDYPEDTLCPLPWGTSSWGQLRLPVLPERSLIKKILVLWDGGLGANVRNRRVWPLLQETSHTCEAPNSLGVGSRLHSVLCPPQYPTLAMAEWQPTLGNWVNCPLIGWGTVWRPLKVRSYKDRRSASFWSPGLRGSSSLVLRVKSRPYPLSDS